MKYRGVFVPLGEYLPDQSFIGDGLSSAYNAVPLDGAWQRFPAHTFPSGGAHAYINEKLRDATYWHDESSARLYAATTSHLWEVNTTTGVLTDRCKAGHYAASTWSFLPFGGIVVAASAGNPLQSVTPGGAFADLATSTTKPQGKYLCSCKGHIILGNITAPAVNPREVRWSGRYAPQDWEPGSNRSGFQEFFGDVGVITGLAGFEDFWLVFTSKSVIRASFVGGDAVWSYQQVGGLHDGMPLGMARSVVTVGRDAFYLSRTGPKVVVSGEAVQDLSAGKVRRVLLDPQQRLLVGFPDCSIAIPYGSTWTPSGACDALRRLVVWGWFADSNGLVLNAVLWAYNIEEQTWSFCMPFAAPAIGGIGASDNLILVARDLGPSLGSVTGYPLQGLGTVWTPGSGDEVNAGSFSGASLAPAIFLTRIADFGPGQTAIHAIRPRVRYVDSAGGGDAVITVTVRAYNNLPTDYAETPDATEMVQTGTTAADDRGFLFLPSGPIRGAFFSFMVSAVDGAIPMRQFKDFLGLDVLLDPEKSDR